MSGCIKNEFGYCFYEFEKDYVHIHSLYIYPQFRRLGKAREILGITIDKIRENGYNGEIKIVAIPREDNISLSDLRKFYQSMGLRVFEYYG